MLYLFKLELHPNVRKWVCVGTRFSCLVRDWVWEGGEVCVKKSFVVTG